MFSEKRICGRFRIIFFLCEIFLTCKTSFFSEMFLTCFASERLCCIHFEQTFVLVKIWVVIEIMVIVVMVQIVQLGGTGMEVVKKRKRFAERVVARLCMTTITMHKIGELATRSQRMQMVWPQLPLHNHAPPKHVTSREDGTIPKKCQYEM